MFQFNGTGSNFDPPFHGANGGVPLVFSKSDMLRAAILTGRTRASVRKFGSQSRLETKWRMSAIQLALDLELPGPGYPPKRLRHPPQWPRLDPSERSALNFTLGSVIAKLIAERVLNTSLLLHHDVYAKFLNSRLGSKDRRPDFAGWTNFPTARWIAMEAKGRVRFPTQKAQVEAKNQATSLAYVHTQAVSCHATCWTHESQGLICAFYQDPPPEDEDGIKLDINPTQFGDQYYAPIRAMLDIARPIDTYGNFATYHVPSLGIDVVLHPKLDRLLRDPSSEEMERFMSQMPIGDSAFNGSQIGPDGIAIMPSEKEPP
jgi:hypothetical protein